MERLGERSKVGRLAQARKRRKWSIDDGKGDVLIRLFSLSLLFGKSATLRCLLARRVKRPERHVRAKTDLRVAQCPEGEYSCQSGVISRQSDVY